MRSTRTSRLILLGLLAALAGLTLAIVRGRLAPARRSIDRVARPAAGSVRRVREPGVRNAGQPGAHARIGEDLGAGVATVSIVFSVGSTPPGISPADSTPSGPQAGFEPCSAWIRLTLLDLAEGAIEGGTRSYSGPTDRDGRILLTLPPGDYRFSVTPDDPRLRGLVNGMRIDSTMDGVEFRWILPVWSGIIAGRVRSAEGGEGIAGVRIRLDPQLEPPRVTRTDATGAFRFEQVAGGSHRVRVEAADVAATFVPPPDILVTLPDREGGVSPSPGSVARNPGRRSAGRRPGPQRVLFVLEVGARVAGRVVARGGQSVRGVRVRAVRQTTGGIAMCELDGEGRYQFLGLAAGAYDLAVLHPFSERALAPSRRLTLSPGMRRDGFDLTVPEPTATLEGDVRLSETRQPRTGAGAARAEAGIVVRLRTGASGPPREQVTGPDGRFRFDGLWPGAYPVEVVQAEDRAFVVEPGSRQLATIPEDGTGWLTLHLVPASSLVFVPLEESAPDDQGWYTVEVAGAGAFHLQCRFPRSRRHLEVGGLPPGRFHVALFTLAADESVEARSEWVVRLEAGRRRRLVEGWNRLP